MYLARLLRHPSRRKRAGEGEEKSSSSKGRRRKSTVGVCSTWMAEAVRRLVGRGDRQDSALSLPLSVSLSFLFLLWRSTPPRVRASRSAPLQHGSSTGREGGETWRIGVSEQHTEAFHFPICNPRDATPSATRATDTQRHRETEREGQGGRDGDTVVPHRREERSDNTKEGSSVFCAQLRRGGYLFLAGSVAETWQWCVYAQFCLVTKYGLICGRELLEISLLRGKVSVRLIRVGAVVVVVQVVVCSFLLGYFSICQVKPPAAQLVSSRAVSGSSETNRSRSASQLFPDYIKALTLCYGMRRGGIAFSEFHPLLISFACLLCCGTIIVEVKVICARVCVSVSLIGADV